MKAEEIIDLLHEYGQNGNSINLSWGAVRALSCYLGMHFHEHCPMCYKKLSIKRFKSVAFESSAPFFRLSCDCGWFGSVYEEPPAGSP